MTSVLEWTYEGDGVWIAHSAIHDDGSAFVWRITVMENGRFSVKESDSELTDYTYEFASLKLAKVFCESAEATYVQTMKI